MDALAKTVVFAKALSFVVAIPRYGDVSQGAAFPCRCTGQCDPDTGNCLSGYCLDGLPRGFNWGGEGCRQGNIALRKPAYHSSTHLGYQADLAVDGYIGPFVTSGQCSYTGDPSPDAVPAWWYVDLGSVHVISSVTLYNHMALGTGFTRMLMSNFTIHVGNFITVSSNPECAIHEGTVTNGGKITFQCLTPMQGRYVGYQSRKQWRDNSASYVGICEFVVIGRSYVDCTNCPSTRSCSDYDGCEQCTNGTLLADCTRECPSELYGKHCNESCSAHCKSPVVCDRVDGRCAGGCAQISDYINDDWWLGERCDIFLPSPNRTMVIGPIKDATTPSSISIKWMGVMELGIAHQNKNYFGFDAYIRKGSSSWTRYARFSFSFEWMYLRFTSLQASTTYEICIVITRTFTDGQVYGVSPGTDTTSVITVSTDTVPSPPPTPAPSPPPQTTTTTTPVATTVLPISVVTSTSPRFSTTPPSKKPSFYTPPAGVTSPTSTVSSPAPIPEGSQTVTDLNAASSSSTPLTVSSGNGHLNVVALAVGLVVALLLITLVAIILVVIIRRRRSRKSGDDSYSERIKTAFYENRRSKVSVAGSIMSVPTEETTWAECEEDLEDVVAEDESIVHVYANERRSVMIAATTINVKGLEDFLNKKKDDREWFKEEMEGLPNGQVLECIAGSKTANRKKNRFKNIKPYDATRVVLDPADDEPSDYINANFITGYSGDKRAYIATQGTRPETIVDFWRMIWQYNTSRIVMLTGLFENGAKKSALYWPKGMGETETHGKVRVTNIKEESLAEYAHTYLQVEKEGENRLVHHLQFLGWPDKSVPTEVFPLLAFRDTVRSMDDSSTGPLVVHCSAGIGRTGSFIAIDFLLQQADAENEIDVVTLVTQMRIERMDMIQTLSQYVFVYDAILEASTCGKTAILNGNLDQEYAVLTKEDESGMRIIDKQFSLLSSLRRSSGRANTLRFLSENSSKEASQKDTLRSAVKNSFDDMVFVNTFKTKNGLVVVRTPELDTIDAFWRLVYERDCGTVITLDTNEDSYMMTPPYWSDEVGMIETYGPMEITLNTTTTKGNITFRTFGIAKTKISKPDKASRTVHHIQLNQWSSYDDLPEHKVLLNLFQHIDSCERNGKILVHCRDGVTRSGLFCAARYLLEKMETKNVVDVFLAVRYVTSVGPHFVSSMNQYQYLYDLACERTKGDPTYENI